MLAKRVLLIGGGILLVSILAIHLIIGAVAFDTADKIDVAIAKEEVEKANTSLNYILENIDRFCSDWAEWDDTYEFILNNK
ncbi:putative periplasmic ligand-binding sensor protein [Ferroglobus placidus DSM 10642]|uniref:Putative periplasmic ligand-binding sensor protein n=1 Tax=Ferroglobus placidus (strain DSM 10642 / AEDII12DO) TaxID=589924 RepID=D3S203_FERPA|nr:CHASE4 domain-containing protein [Ferroglobus placidus]ADC64460.1 putative periplasmic ligand-binding sensor protein [Ferroglobus placidus DSM 10642]